MANEDLSPDDDLSTLDQVDVPTDVRRTNEVEVTSELEDEGIPDPNDAPPGRLATGGEEDVVAPPRDFPQAVREFGTTAAEERMDEPVALRASRYEPDFGADDAGDPDDEPTIASDFPLGVGRLVDDGSGDVDDSDETPGVLVDDAGYAGGGYSEEEAAMHVTDEPLAGELGGADPTGGYGVFPGDV